MLLSSEPSALKVDSDLAERMFCFTAMYSSMQASRNAWAKRPSVETALRTKSEVFGCWRTLSRTGTGGRPGCKVWTRSAAFLCTSPLCMSSIWVPKKLLSSSE